MLRRSAAIASFVIALSVPGVASAADETTTPGRGGATSETNGGNGTIDTNAERAVIEGLKDVLPAGAKADDPDPGEWYEYLVIVNCEGNTVENINTEVCAAAATYCADNGQGTAIWHRMYRRIVTRDGDTGDWEQFGTTCFPDALPARSGGGAPVLGINQIIAQFHSTAFALPQTSMEPPGGQTLVNIPTFFELQWPEDGVEPQEIDNTVLIGYNVRIRPTFVNATYDFGDGDAQGPVSSLGGTWPDGDIQHTYLAKETVNPSISVIYGGEYSVNGAAWQPIPGTVTIDGPPQPLEVLTSRNRLVPNPGS